MPGGLWLEKMCSITHECWLSPLQPVGWLAMEVPLWRSWTNRGCYRSCLKNNLITAFGQWNQPATTVEQMNLLITAVKQTNLPMTAIGQKHYDAIEQWLYWTFLLCTLSIIGIQKTSLFNGVYSPFCMSVMIVHPMLARGSRWISTETHNMTALMMIWAIIHMFVL